MIKFSFQPKSFVFLLFITLLFAGNHILVSALSCDKVASLPGDFDLLLPNNDKLKRIHLSNYFFLDDLQDSKDKTLTLKINIKEKSVVKIQVTPWHSSIDMIVTTPAGSLSMTTTSGIPVDFTEIDPKNLIQGTIELQFTNRIAEENEANDSLLHSETQDRICDTPYMYLEIYIEQYTAFKERISNIKDVVRDLDEFSPNFEEIFAALMQSETKTKSSVDKQISDLKVKKTTNELTPYKISLKQLKFYEKFNISVINEFDLTIPDEEVKPSANYSDMNPQHHIITKIFLKIQMYSDFLVGGSFYFLLIQARDFALLDNYNCYYAGRCLFSEKPSKNGIILETILTPGDYKILLVNMHHRHDMKQLKKFLEIPAIPVTAAMKVKHLLRSENRFNCEGRRLPNNFDFLLDTAYSNNYMEYKGDIVINMESMRDEVEITVPNDSDYIMRLTTFFYQGNSIDLELLEYDNEKLDITKLASNVANRVSPIFDKFGSFYTGKKNSESRLDYLVTLSKNAGGTSSLYVLLTKGKMYKVVLSYENSFFEQFQRKSCELFYMKLVIAKQSYIKSFLSDAFLPEQSCNSGGKFNVKDTLEKMLTTFEKEHDNDSKYGTSEYTSTSTEMRTFVKFSANSSTEKSDVGANIIHAQNFKVKKEINLNIEVISDYLTGDIIPLIIPGISNTPANEGINDLLHKKYKRFVLHESSLNLKLRPGGYMLVLIHGLTQLNNSDNNRHLGMIRMQDLPKCISFKLRINSILLHTKKMLNWDCNYKHYSHLPEALDITNRERYAYFNKNVLVPRDESKITITTGNDGYILQLAAQIKEDSDITSDKTAGHPKSTEMEITLVKGEKIIRTAKNEIFEYDLVSDIVYINYYLRPNKNYELHFTNKSNTSTKKKDTAKYFDKCRVFLLEINLVNEKSLKNANQCDVSVPSVENLIYERLIDVSDSFVPYGANVLQKMFTSITDQPSPTQIDLEVFHPKGSMFKFPLKFDSSKKNDMAFSFPFTIKQRLARATLLIESPYAMPVAISAKIRMVKGSPDSKEDEKYGELIASGDMEDEGVSAIRGLALEGGNYTLEIYINRRLLDKQIISLFTAASHCVNFSASVLIENKPFDLVSKSTAGQSEKCPYLEFPDNLNIPGWISADTGNSINENLRFKIKSDHLLKRFVLTERSLFKFYLPEDTHNNFHSYISLFKLQGNKSQKLIEKLEKNDNYISAMLGKGSYLIEFHFEIPENRMLFGKGSLETSCIFFDLYIAVQPVSQIIGVKGGVTKDNAMSICESKTLSLGDELLTGSIERQLIKFPNVESESESTVVKTFKLRKLEKNDGKFVGEFIFNQFTDPIYKIYVYKLSEDDSARQLVSTDFIAYENFIWVVFHCEKGVRYVIELVSGLFSNHSACATGVFSYNYEEYMNSESTTQEEYLASKDKCEIEDSLPSSMYVNDGNVLNKYGGPQAISDGELNFSGTFLLPRSSMTVRTEFVIKSQSIAFMKLVPLYEKSNQNNIILEIFHGQTAMFRFSHSENKGMILQEFSQSKSSPDAIAEDTKYNLDITFDRLLSACEGYQLIFTIVPKQIYLNEYMSCNDNEEHLDTIPDSLQITDKSQQFSFKTFLTLTGDKAFSKMSTWLEGNVEKNVSITLTHPISFTAVLKYFAGESMMDIAIEDTEGNILELGKESFEVIPTGIQIIKEISVYLKKGKYQLKIVFHKLFSEMLKRIIPREINGVCFFYLLDIEANILKIKDENKTQNEDDESNDLEINHLSKTDFNLSGNKVNVITSVDPMEENKLKLGTEFNIVLKFAYEFNLTSGSELMNMIYLQDTDTSPGAYGNKIYPTLLKAIGTDFLTFSFLLNKRNFSVKKCYKLFLDENFKNLLEDEAIEVDGISRIYCTMKCECNPAAKFRCKKSGKCECKAPYSGITCDSCIDGYVRNDAGQCVEKGKISMKCDEKVTCSEHGTCVSPNLIFDPYSSKVPCKCNDGYTSSKGYPAVKFCNTCTNPSKIYPLCTESQGQQSSDFIKFTFESPCSEIESAPSLPQRLFAKVSTTEEEEDGSSISSADLAAFDGGQDVDGSLDMIAVFNAREGEEYSEFVIREESLIRLYYESAEINRARIFILSSKYDTHSIADTDGKDKSESFIAKLDPREKPYVLKIMHTNLKINCNRYRLKIVIRPMKMALSELKCKSNINVNDANSLLPPSLVTIENTATIFFADRIFYLPDHLILDKEKYKDYSKNPKSKPNEMIDYTQSGILTKGDVDAIFYYNIKLDVKAPITFSASSLYDFLTSEITINLRDNSGKFITKGSWVVPEANFHSSDHDFIHTLNSILDPGIYFLTLSQDESSNQLLQLILDMENSNNKKQNHINRCFKFNLHLQTSPINKPDPGISTTKFESMYNRILTVEPETLSNINISKKLELFITFEHGISPVINPKYADKSFKHAFFFENARTKENVIPGHVYLQGTVGQTFLIVYDENSLAKDECYELKYNLDYLQSRLDKDQKIAGDAPIIHKYCSKSCNCNPHTSFECDASTGKCICEEPYMGDGCNECMWGWKMAKGKCITEVNCAKTFCNGFGKCAKSSSSVSAPPKCECKDYFKGNDCSECVDASKVFPDCAEVDVSGKVKGSKEDEYQKFLQSDSEDLEKSESEAIRCDHTFIPHNLDSLGYLHLDGNMHISGKYSLKHINNKHYSMTFTIKEPSHVRIYIEHAKSTHVISMFLLDSNKKYLHTGKVHVGPAGVGSASLLDIIINPISEDNQFKNYEIDFFIKDTTTNDGDMIPTYEEAANAEVITNQCFTVFLEMQVMTLARESNVVTHLNKDETCTAGKEKTPVLIPKDSSLYDYHTFIQEGAKTSIVKSAHVRSAYSQSPEVPDPVYFYYEYFYIPDHLDQEVVVELQVDSKFLNSHVGVLLEIVEIPFTVKIDHKKLTSKSLSEIFEKEKLTVPLCEIHCFTGVKKYNSVFLNRILPSDTFFRIWFYDLQPSPYVIGNVHFNINSVINSCILYESFFTISNVNASTKSLAHKKEAALCLSNELPTNLNIKEYLGDSKYLKKWGFHILDSFRIDRSIDKGSLHVAQFDITEFHLLRVIVFPGRVDTDLELFIVKNKVEDILIARSSSKSFEDAIVIEIPPGRYKLVFKFFPPPSGFHKCEAMRMEFAMDPFHNISENLNRMTARHKNNPKHSAIDFLEHIKNEREIFSKNVNSLSYTIPLESPFVVNVDDTKNYLPSISVSELTFVIEPEDTGKVEFIAYVSSDFLYLDASLYLSYSSSSASIKNSKVISATHKKNMNVLSTGPLEGGTYIVSVRYYRRLHYQPFEAKDRDSVLHYAKFAELEFDAMMTNKSNDYVSILTSGGYLKVPPLSKSRISHNWLCRNAGLPVPSTLSTLRYLIFNTDVHIIDTFILPLMGEGEEVIKFKTKYAPSMMLRVYVECHSVDIDIELRERKSKTEYFTLAKSNESIHFETIMQLIRDDTDYEIVLTFKGMGEEFSVKVDDPSSACRTFKMEIAIEKNHNYACPNSSKYAMLTELKPIPGVLPVSYSNPDAIYRYDSRDFFKGEDHDSGYVYMLRKEADEVIEYATFLVQSPIDMKVEIVNDFLQAPINIMLASIGNDETPPSASETFSLAAKAFGLEKLNDAYIVEYGEIFENRSSLLVKNLPKGRYSFYVYIPGLKTKFINEPRVCSIYDMLVEVKKSRHHFKQTEIINTSEIQDDNLDFPVNIPETLNSLRFMSGYGPYTYVNYANDYYLRFNKTNIENVNKEEHYDLYNSFSFTVISESIVEFYVNHDLHKEKLHVAIEGNTQFSEYTAAVLKPGQYKGVIKLEKAKIPSKTSGKQNESFILDSIYHLVQFYFGFTPISRVNEIYQYNNMQSTFRQCRSQIFPSQLEYEEKSNHYSYHNEFFTFRTEDLRSSNTIGQFTVKLDKSDSNRILCEIGSDYVLNKLSMNVKHGSKVWRSAWVNNIGDLDITVPMGTYTFEVVIDETILASEYACIVFSIDIHIVDNNYFSKSDIDTHMHPIYNKHVITGETGSSHSKSNLLGMRCDGGVLPLEIYKNADVEYHRIKNNGEYFLHMAKTTYFINRQITKSFENLNEIDINISELSIVRISTTVENPKEFQIIPKMKLFVRNKPENENNKYINPNLESASHNMKERNGVWMLERNKHETDEFYTLELIQERYEELSESSPSYHCPYYQLDVLIHSISEVAKKFECIKEEGKIVEYMLPNQNLPAFKSDANISPFHEKIGISYFTENQYGDFHVTSDSYNGLSYSISFTIEETSSKEPVEYYFNLSLGYDHLISLFEIYLSKYDKNEDIKKNPPKIISLGTGIFEKADDSFPYKRVIQTTLSPGRYAILIGESMWVDISRNIKAYTKNEGINLCIPFSYSLDIVPLNEKVHSAEIISVFPPGPIAFKSIDEDMNIKLVLSKAPFTSKHEPVTAIFNFMSIVNAFYLKKVPTRGVMSSTSNPSEGEAVTIHPDKVQGNINAKEWELLFLQHHFEPNYDYELHYDNSWLIDIHHSKFTLPKIMPVIRIETSKEAIFDFVDSIKGMKAKMTEGEFKPETKSPNVTVTLPQSMAGDNVSKCGAHGKLIYDNILRRDLCTCFDGFSGKFCQFCEGEIVDGKCTPKDEEDETNIPEEESSSGSKGTFTSTTSSDSSTTSSPIPVTRPGTSYCGGCNNGICDVKTGRCICEKGYTGKHCEKFTSSSSSSVSSTQPITKQAEYTTGELIFKFTIAVVLLILLWYLYKFMKEYSFPLSKGYELVSQAEFEMRVSNESSINDPNKPQGMELSSDNQLVDYDIRGEKGTTKKIKKKDNKKDIVDKKTEL